MSDARLIRRVAFHATHRYAGEEAHGHAWRLEVHVVGPLGDDSGFLVDLEELDRAIADVTRGWDGGDLNERVPPVRAGNAQPSTEFLARWIHGTLAPLIPPPARLERVRLWESDDLAGEFPV